MLICKITSAALIGEMYLILSILRNVVELAFFEQSDFLPLMHLFPDGASLSTRTTLESASSC